MSVPAATPPRVVHETATRLRLRWAALGHPALEPAYLEAWLEQQPGVLKVRVNPRARSLALRHDGRPGLRSEVLQAFQRIPQAAFSRSTPAPPRRRLVDVLAHLAAALGLRLLPPPLALAGAAPLGAPAVLRGLDTLVNRGLKVPVLDMATIGLSLLRGDAAAAAGISAMVVIGEYLRQATEDRSNSLLKSLLTPPLEAVLLERPDGREETVPFARVREGDLVLCGPGEILAVDGVVERGRALLNKSSITGESCPEESFPGQAALSGSLVLEGGLAVRAQRAGGESNMARIAGFMERTLAEKSRPERLGDRLADRLAGLSLGLGATVYALTGNAERATAAFTVDYACPVKLPAPAVIKASMYAAGRQGQLVKSGSALDALARAETVVFDKTGTLTRGVMSVAGVLSLPGVNPDRLLVLAASAEDRWGHPAGLALLAEAARRGLDLLPVRDTDYAAAHGVNAMVDGVQVRAGSRHFLDEDSGVPCSALDALARDPRHRGRSLVYVALDGRPAGVVTLRDSLRPEAAQVLTALRRRGVRRIVVLTGDREEAARALLRRLPGLDEVHAGQTPTQKARAVERLRGRGGGVAVVGDGINDAPALLAGDVGVCMAGPSGLVRESAGIVLLRDGLWGLVTARDLGARAAAALRACLDAGLAVNSGLLLAAGAGLLRPVQAAALHNGATFSLLAAASWACGREPGEPAAQSCRDPRWA